MVVWRGKFSAAVCRLLLFLGSLIALALNPFVSVTDAWLRGRDFVHVSWEQFIPECMFLCMCVCCLSMCICICVFCVMCLCLSLCMCVCLCVQMCLCVYTDVCICVFMSLCVFVNECVSVHVSICLSGHTYTSLGGRQHCSPRQLCILAPEQSRCVCAHFRWLDASIGKDGSLAALPESTLWEVSWHILCSPAFHPSFRGIWNPLCGEAS